MVDTKRQGPHIVTNPYKSFHEKGSSLIQMISPHLGNKLCILLCPCSPTRVQF